MNPGLTKLRAMAVLIVLAAGAAACDDDGAVTIASPPFTAPTSTGSPSATESPSVPPTGSPGVTGTLTAGTASVTTTGGLDATVGYDTLFTPGIWTLPPGAIALSWQGNGRQALSITGSSFAAQLPTDIDRVLEFSVPSPDGLQTFRSSSGECLITISPALADQMGGSFACTSLLSGDGALTVNAQGSFSAQGSLGTE